MRPVPRRGPGAGPGRAGHAPARRALRGRGRPRRTGRGLAFGRDYGIAYPSISDPDNLIAARFGAVAPTATPSTYILDARGRIAWAWFGRTYYNQLETAVIQAAGR